MVCTRAYLLSVSLLLGYALEVNRDGVFQVFTFPCVTNSNRYRYYCRELFLYEDTPTFGIGGARLKTHWRISQEVTKDLAAYPVFLADFKKSYKKVLSPEEWNALVNPPADYDPASEHDEFKEGLRQAYVEARAYDRKWGEDKLRAVYNGNVFVPEWFEMEAGSLRSAGA